MLEIEHLKQVIELLNFNNNLIIVTIKFSFFEDYQTRNDSLIQISW